MFKRTDNIPDKWLVFPALALFVILLIKITLLKGVIAHNFFHGDLSVHCSNLFFLAKYGFHQIIPNWYNGIYILFEAYPPGWSFFSLPFYYILNNVIAAASASLIATYILGVIFLLILGKINGFSAVKVLAFFSFFYATPMILSATLDTGRYPDMFAWTLGFLLFCLIFYYKEKALDAKFYILFALVETVLLLTHIWVTVVSSMLILGFFLRRPLKEILLGAVCILTALIATSFWWMPFVKIIMYSMEKFLFTNELLTFGSIFSFNTLILPAFLVLFFYYYITERKPKAELLFYLPSVILCLLVLSRLILFIPVFNKILVPSYNYYFLILAIILMLKARFSVLPRLAKLIVYILLFALPFASAYVTFVHFGIHDDYSDTQKDMIALLPYIHEKYIAMGNIKSTNPVNPVVTYGAIVYNLNSTSGNYFHGAPLLHKKLLIADEFLAKGNCSALRSAFEDFDVNIVLTHTIYCNTMQSCGFTQVISNSNACLFSKA